MCGQNQNLITHKDSRKMIINTLLILSNLHVDILLVCLKEEKEQF